MGRIIGAALVAAALAGAAGAQEGRMMERGLSMLERSVGGTFRRHGVEVDPRSLTLGQVARIIELQSSRGDDDPQLSRSQLEAVARGRRSFSPGQQ